MENQETKPKTLRDIVASRKIRKGEPARITRDGAYWIIKTDINACGGDGIGQSPPIENTYLTVRRYRSGEMRAYLSIEWYHQHDGDSKVITRADDVLDASTIEELIQLIKSHKIVIEYGDPLPVVVTAEGGCRLRLEYSEMIYMLPAPDEV